MFSACRRPNSSDETSHTIGSFKPPRRPTIIRPRVTISSEKPTSSTPTASSGNTSVRGDSQSKPAMATSA